ncbi:MAG: type II toxin-antitoxin system RelE/ParE family toxin [Wenzhouxiangellaceae bacterium]
MPSYKFAASAEADIQDILDYSLPSWGRDRALAYLADMQTLVASLAKSPKLGKSCSTLGTGLLAFPYRSHVLYYRSEPEGIIIVRILHQRMNPDLHF